jgi:hypothetical protein
MSKTNNITRDEFSTYELIRKSGLTNMFDVENVIKYSIVIGVSSLTKAKIVEIMKNYDKYLKLYPQPSEDWTGFEGNPI